MKYTVPFTQMSTKIIQSKTLSVYEKAVYAVLCSHANQDADCFPSYKTIAAETPCSERQAKSIIKQLEIKGYIIINHRKDDNGKSRSNIYRILTDSEQGTPSKGECSAHKLYKYNNINSFDNIHLSINEQKEIDEIIENFDLAILNNKSDQEIFEEVIRRMYAAPFIKVYNINQPQIAVRKRLRNLTQEIICSAFDKYAKETNCCEFSQVRFAESYLTKFLCTMSKYEI